jgi:aspartate carbamoyltransferase regulatory subunit
MFHIRKKKREPEIELCVTGIAVDCDNESCIANKAIPVNGVFVRSELKNCFVINGEVEIETWIKPRKR